MKIKIKKSRRIGFTFYIPIRIVKFFLRDRFVRFAMRHISEKERKYMQNIDYKVLREALDILKDYKDLNLVNIESADGEIVRIII